MQQNLIDAARAVIAADRAGELTDELITALEKELTRAETPRGRGPYGVDTGYFDRKLARVIPALDNYTPGDLAREFARMAAVADRDAAFAELAPAGFVPAAAEAAPQPAQQPAFLQVYRAKLKSRKQMERDIPPGMRGWWFDVSAGCELRLRQATQSDVDRCTLADEASRNPDDYMCEIFERGSLVSKIAIEFMNAERNVFVAAPQPKEGGD